MNRNRIERLEDRLRAEAADFRAADFRAGVPPGLARRALERVEAAGSRPSAPQAVITHPGIVRRAWIAAAAAVLVAAAAGTWFGRSRAPSAGPGPRVVDAELVVRPLGRLLALDFSPVEEALRSGRGEVLVAQGNPLQAEARKMWLDASRAAQELANQLPSPLREALVAR